MEHSMDIYDRAVAFLTSHPDQIFAAWDDPMGHPAGILFQVASPTGNYQLAEDRIGQCGELCEIVSGQAVSFTDEMTEIIREDERIPLIENEVPKIGIQVLEAFAEWQRLFDITWDRNPEETFQNLGFNKTALAA
jgi:hypothetical protein